MAAERAPTPPTPTLTPAQGEAIASLVAALAHDAWLTRQALTAEGRAPHRDARPCRSSKEEHGGPITGCPEDILRR